MVRGNNDRGRHFGPARCCTGQAAANRSVLETYALACRADQVCNTADRVVAVGDRVAPTRLDHCLAQAALPAAAPGEARSPIVTAAMTRDEIPSAENCDDTDAAPVERVAPVEPTELASTDSLDAGGEPETDIALERERAGFTPVAAVGPAAPSWPAWLSSIPFSRALFIGWFTVSATIAVGQFVRIVRFRRRLRGALPAPEFLVDEADRIGRWLGVHVPDLLVVDELGTPMLWCLGRPQLSAADAAGEDASSRTMARHPHPRAGSPSPAAINGSPVSSSPPVSSGGGTRFTGSPVPGWMPKQSWPATPGSFGPCRRIDSLMPRFSSIFARPCPWPSPWRPR